MGKIIGIFSILTISSFLIFLLITCDRNFDKLAKDIEIKQNEILLNIGKRVILNKDTLIVVNYNSGYVLSNGVTINDNLLNKLEIIK